MADELIKAGSGLPAPQMNVTATQGATAIGQVVGDVRLEMGPEAVALLQHIIGNQQTVSHAAEWALLNQERFSVFVLENERYDCGSFCIGRRVALTKNTLPDYWEYYRPLTQPLIQELLNMPCIFAVRNPNFKQVPEHYPAFVGRLRRPIRPCRSLPRPRKAIDTPLVLPGSLPDRRCAFHRRHSADC